MTSFKKFLLNYTKKYRMWADGATEEETQAQRDVAEQKEYIDMMRDMRLLGVTGLNLDVRNLKAYPPTLKLWHQLQAYPQEVVPLMDQLLKDVMIEEAAKELRDQMIRQQHQHHHEQRARLRRGASSSEPAMPSSEADQTHGDVNGAPPSESDVLADIESRIYKIRPFGLDNSINLRELNPSGMTVWFVQVVSC